MEFSSDLPDRFEEIALQKMNLTRHAVHRRILPRHHQGGVRDVGCENLGFRQFAR